MIWGGGRRAGKTYAMEVAVQQAIEALGVDELPCGCVTLAGARRENGCIIVAFVDTVYCAAHSVIPGEVICSRSGDPEGARSRCSPTHLLGADSGRTPQIGR